MRGLERQVVRSDEEAKVSLVISEILPWAREWYYSLQSVRRTGQPTTKAIKV